MRTKLCIFVVEETIYLSHFLSFKRRNLAPMDRILKCHACAPFVSPEEKKIGETRSQSLKNALKYLNQNISVHLLSHMDEGVKKLELTIRTREHNHVTILLHIQLTQT